MELLTEDEINSIVKNFDDLKVIDWTMQNYSDSLIGYLGDHLRLTIRVDDNGTESTLKLFLKCLPRFDKWKANYLEECNFFKKEYAMLGDLFKKFDLTEESKWRPKLLFIKENVFVFEDVSELGYKMPPNQYTLSYDGTIATVATIAKFHAQSYIYEEKKTIELNRPYRILEDYSTYLQEPSQGKPWRDAGRDAVIDYLKLYSAHRKNPYFAKSLEVIVPMLFDGAAALMKPSSVYRNVVVHRDLWTNNIFLKQQDDGKVHALLVDFQTVIYASPMLELSSLLFFNTTRSFRDTYINEILDFYYEVLSGELKSEGIGISQIFDKDKLSQAYEDSIMFGITQAAIIVPLAIMSAKRQEELYSNPETSEKINIVSRSSEIIETAKEDQNYYNRVTELLEEIVDRYVCLSGNHLIQKQTE